MAFTSRTAVGEQGQGGVRRVAGASAVLCMLMLPTIAGAAQTQSPETCFGSAATIVGTAGPDQLVGTPGDDVIVGLGGDDSIDASSGGSDKICGEDGGDTILGGPGNDQIDGGPGSDAVVGGLGDDVLAGGDGIDLVAYFTSPVGVQVSLATGTAGGAGTDSLSGFEAIWGSAFGDILEGDASLNFFFPDVLQFLPAGSNDLIRGGAGFDVVSFEGRVNANLATGRATGEGEDVLVGIEGFAGQRASTFTGNAGQNFLMGGGENDVLDGAGGNDTILGLAGNDRLLGGAGADLVDGGGGDDTLDGGLGSRDIVTYLNAPSPITASLATGRARGDGADILRGFESIVGSQFSDILAGSAGPDTLQGKGGNDRVIGGRGDDFLDGGEGRDRLNGGPGGDYCFDGEANSGCEAVDRSAAGSSSFVNHTQIEVQRRSLAALHALASGRPVAEPAAAPHSPEVPFGDDAAALSGGDLLYRNTPTCAAQRNRFVTTIKPPDWVDLPGEGEHTVLWQGLLKDRRGVVKDRTVFVRAVFPEGYSGYIFPNQWQDLRTGRTYQPRRITVSGSQVNRWEAEIRVEGQPPSRPHVVAPPCPAIPRS